MQVRILGCSGGIGQGLRTTSILVGESVLIDAGTGIGDLPLSTLQKIRSVYLTHSHLDHVCGLPLLIDTIFEQLTTPLTVFGRIETIDAVRAHIFNNVIWPDFSRIPNVNQPVLKLQAVDLNKPIDIGSATLELIAVNHVVPACGYRITGKKRVLAFSGDTTSNDSFWDALNAGTRLDYLVVESAFPNSDIELCRLACHYCPSLLAEDIKKLTHKPEIYLTHAKPGAEQEILNECKSQITNRKIYELVGGEIFVL